MDEIGVLVQEEWDVDLVLLLISGRKYEKRTSEEENMKRRNDLVTSAQACTIPLIWDTINVMTNDQCKRYRDEVQSESSPGLIVRMRMRKDECV
jgi:hypothetical protein